MYQGCAQTEPDRARHIAEYVVNLISDSHNVRLRRLLISKKKEIKTMVSVYKYRSS